MPTECESLFINTLKLNPEGLTTETALHQKEIRTKLKELGESGAQDETSTKKSDTQTKTAQQTPG